VWDDIVTVAMVMQLREAYCVDVLLSRRAVYMYMYMYSTTQRSYNLDMRHS
jgi:hypothetical protein